jgi:hypothetical protein
MSQRVSFVLSELGKKAGTPEPEASSHHVVSVEAPTLPRRRAGLCVVACALCWGLSTIGLAVAIVAAGRDVWGQTLAASFLLRSVRKETGVCSLRVFASDCTATKLQLHVSLGLLLEGIVDESEIQVDGGDGEFTVKLDSCGTALASTIVSESVVAAWKGKLSLIRSCNLFVSNVRPQGGAGRRRPADTETEEGRAAEPAGREDDARVATARGTLTRGRGDTSVVKAVSKSKN